MCFTVLQHTVSQQCSAIRMHQFPKQLPRLQLRLAPYTTVAYGDCDSLGETESGVPHHYHGPDVDHRTIRRLVMLWGLDKCTILQHLSQHSHHINCSPCNKVHLLRVISALQCQFQKCFASTFFNILGSWHFAWILGGKCLGKWTKDKCLGETSYSHSLTSFQ